MRRRRISRTLLRTLRSVMHPNRPRRTAKSVGLPPGTLVYTGPERDQPTRITAMVFEEQGVEEREVGGVQELARLHEAARDGRVVWANFDGVQDTGLIAETGAAFAIDPLVLEDIVRVGQRPKLEPYEGYLYIVLRMFVLDAAHEQIRHEQVSIVVGDGFVLTFQEQPGDLFDPVRQRIREGKGRIRGWGAAYLAYALLDTIIDHYFVVLEHFSERIEEVEAVVTQTHGEEVVSAIHLLKRENLFFRRSVWPLRELVGGLLRGETPLLHERLRPYLRDLYDHTVELVDTVETLRDMLGSLLDIYLSSVSNRMNEVMKVLTIITTIFVPLTFIAGVYGMNFQYMPELHLRWAYPAVLIVMVLLFAFMLSVFRRKDWL